MARTLRLSGRSAGLEGHRHTVHAIAQARRLWAVVENVAEMAAAAVAVHRGADHAEGPILLGTDRVVERLPKTRPTGAAVELGIGGIERQVAAGACEGALAMLFEQRAGEGPLRRRLPQHREL